MTKNLGLLWALSLPITFYLGYSYKSPPLIPPTDFISAEKVNVLVNEYPIDGDYSQANIKPKNQQLEQKNNVQSTIALEKITVSDALDEVRLLLDGGMDMEGIAKAFNRVNSFSDKELKQALLELESTANQPDNQRLLSLLLSKYAEEQPHAAIAYIDKNISSAKSKSRLASRVVATWAKKDAQAAYDWYVNQEGPTGLQRLHPSTLSPVFTELAKQDYYSAFNKLIDLADTPNEQRWAVYGITRTFTSQNEFADLMDQSSDFADRRFKDTVLRGWVKRDPQEAIEWIANVDNSEERTKLETNVLSTWMYSEPQAAANWYLGNAEEGQKQKYAEKIVNKWAYRDPAMALDWIGQQTDIDREKSTVKLLNSAAYKNTDFAMNNLNLLNNEKDIITVSSRIHRSLERNNPTKAAEFVAQSPVKEELQKRIDKYKKSREKKGKG